MNENINLCEILKNTPKGTKFYTPIYGEVEFNEIDNVSNFPIRTKVKDNHVSFTKEGYFTYLGIPECMLFPSKDQRDWSKYQRRFKDGDIIYNRFQKKICIYFLYEGETPYIKDCRYNESSIQLKFEKLEGPIPIVIQDYRLATEEEKRKLFQAIKDNGYEWNAETKTLEKLINPKFKVGDIIQDKDSYKVKIMNIDIKDRFYIYESLIDKGLGTIIFHEQDDWELVKYQVGDHFIHLKDSELFVITDIQNDGAYDVQSLEGSRIFGLKKLIIDACLKTDKWNPKWFKPFDKVLVRDSQHDTWVATLFSHIGNNEIYPYITSYTKFKYCIPYNIETKHLVGTTNEAPEFYIN